MKKIFLERTASVNKRFVRTCFIELNIELRKDTMTFHMVDQILQLINVLWRTWNLDGHKNIPTYSISSIHINVKRSQTSSAINVQYRVAWKCKVISSKLKSMYNLNLKWIWYITCDKITSHSSFHEKEQTQQFNICFSIILCWNLYLYRVIPYLFLFFFQLMSP